MVRVERPQASRRSSHEPLCRTGRILEETAICVVDSTGQIVKEARAASEPETLIAALREIDLPLERVGLEACSLTAWLHDELHSAGLPAVCVENATPTRP